MFFPNFEFIDRTYNNLEEPGFPYDEIKAVFPKVLTVKYEDGKYMVKDVGADIAKVYNSVDYKHIKLSLVDGWWVCELDEEIYNDESIDLFVYFEGKIDGIYWNITYDNGTVNRDLYLMQMSDDLGVLVYYDDYDRVVSMYYVGDRLFNDEYKNGALDSQESSLFVGEDHVYIEYLADGSWERVRIYRGNDWYYYYPDGSWEKGVEVLLTPPAGYENADVAYFESILPTTINCAHENIKAADCESPEYCLTCGIVSEGSEPLGHNYVGELTVNNTCSSVGEMTYVCQNDASHFYTEEVAIDENAHAWNEGVVTTAPTCSTVGTKTYTCTHNSEHTKTEDVAIDASAHAHGSEWKADANEHWNECECGDKANKAAHADSDNNGKCDTCNYEMSSGAVDAGTDPKPQPPIDNPPTDDDNGLGTGAIIAIVTAGAAVVGGGGLALWWFVFRKKRII